MRVRCTGLRPFATRALGSHEGSPYGIAGVHGTILARAFVEINNVGFSICSDLLRSFSSDIVTVGQMSLIPTRPPLETGGKPPDPHLEGESL